MNRSFSLYLDLLRIMAAMAVFVQHFAFYRISEGRWSFLNAHLFGTDAVIVFFVLSGLVISYCGDEKDATLGTFAFSRVTRLLSVAIPALFLGYLFDRAGAFNAPEYYDADWYNPISLVTQLLSGLSFTNEWWITVTRLGTNGPYWSLSFEAAYYMLFAVVFYLRSPLKWLLALGLLAVFGPAVLLLLPCWLVGWGVWRLIASGWAPSRPVALALALAPAPIFCALVLTRVDVWLKTWNQTNLPETLIDHIGNRAMLFEWAYILAALVAAHLLGMHALLKPVQAPEKSRLADGVRFFAGCSFSIYLLHYPLMHALSSSLRGVLPSYAKDAALLTVTLAVCIAVAMIFERTLGRQRRVLRGVGKRLLPPAPQEHRALR